MPPSGMINDNSHGGKFVNDTLNTFRRFPSSPPLLQLLDCDSKYNQLKTMLLNVIDIRI